MLEVGGEYVLILKVHVSRGLCAAQLNMTVKAWPPHGDEGLLR